MKTRILSVLVMLIISGAVAFPQEKQKSHQHQAPAKTEKSSEVTKPEAGSGCNGAQTASCCSKTETKHETDQSQKDSKEVSSVVYTCPMHPEVVSDEPGKCPKCGMDLTKKK